MEHRSVRRSRAVLVALLATTGLGGTRSASAQGERVPLSWSAPSGCPAAAAVLAEVKRNLADSGEARAPFVAVASVDRPVEGMWHARLRVEARGGTVERQFDAESCEAIASAAALIIALSAGPGGDAPPPEPPQGATISGEARSGAAQSGRAPPEDHWRLSQLSVMVNAVIDGGTMPGNPAAGVEAAAGPLWTAPGWRLRLLAGAGFFPTQQMTYLQGDVDIWLLTVSGRGCVAAAPARFEIGLCVGGELSAMHSADPHTSRAVKEGTQYWVSPVGSAMASWRVSSRGAIFGRAEVAVPGTRRTFQTSDNADLYRVRAVAARGALGLELRFF